MGRKSKYPPEVRERAVRLVFERNVSPYPVLT
jgi:transposase-like protein